MTRCSYRNARRGLTSVCAALVCLAVAATPIAPVHAAPLDVHNGDRAKELNLEGQKRFDVQDYEGAASSWSRILEVLPENTVNREERENSLLIALEAYKEAFRSRRAAGGDDALKSAVEHLRKGVALHAQYGAEYQRAYGNGARIGSAAQDSGAEIQRMLEDAERELGGSAPAPTPIIDPSPTPTSPTRDFGPVRGPSGNGLIAGGSILIALGLGSTSMIIIGGLQAKEARREYRDASAEMDEAGKDAADRKGKRANGLIAGGAVMTGVFLAAGATMLGFGIRRRVRYQAVAPMVGPQYVGIGVQGRF